MTTTDPVPARKERPIRTPLTTATLLATLTLFAPAAHASVVDGHRLGRWSPGKGNVINAIYKTWCGRYVRCASGDEALTVARCETGGTFSVWASNGQYLGLFQMGDYARSRYGHSTNPWGQAKAAHRYWKDDGWGPWQCHEHGGLRW